VPALSGHFMNTVSRFLLGIIIMQHALLSCPLPSSPEKMTPLNRFKGIIERRVGGRGSSALSLFHNLGYALEGLFRAVGLRIWTHLRMQKKPRQSPRARVWGVIFIHPYHPAGGPPSDAIARVTARCARPASSLIAGRGLVPNAKGSWSEQVWSRYTWSTAVTKPGCPRRWR